jgi:hypothetical protein
MGPLARNVRLLSLIALAEYVLFLVRGRAHEAFCDHRRFGDPIVQPMPVFDFEELPFRLGVI